MKDYIIPTIFLFGTLFLGWLYLQEPDSADPLLKLEWENKKGKKIIYNKIREYQKETEIKAILQRKKAELNKKLNRGGSEIERVSSPSTEEIKVFNPTPLEEVFEEESPKEALNLDQKMDQFLAKREFYEAMETAERKAYVEEFIRSAYQMGYIVKINEQMEIESITEIKRR